LSDFKVKVSSQVVQVTSSEHSRQLLILDEHV